MAQAEFITKTVKKLVDVEEKTGITLHLTAREALVIRMLTGYVLGSSETTLRGASDDLWRTLGELFDPDTMRQYLSMVGGHISVSGNVTEEEAQAALRKA